MFPLHTSQVKQILTLPQALGFQTRIRLAQMGSKQTPYIGLKGMHAGPWTCDGKKIILDDDIAMLEA